MNILRKTFVVFILAACINTMALAQNSSNVLTVNSINIPADRLSITDSIAPDNKPVYMASFDIAVKDAEDTKSVIVQLQTWLQENKMASLSLSLLNRNFEVAEERLYSNVSIQEIAWPAADAASRSAAKISVKIKAGALQINYDTKNKIQVAPVRAVAALISSYRFQLGILPANRVSAISGLSAGKSTQEFTIEVSMADAREWNQWLAAAKKGPGSPKKEQGSIALLTPDLKNTIMELGLKEVSIISYNVNSNSNDQSIARANIRLRAQSVTITKGK